jgi:uncharacterized protein (DUF2267 family)
MDQLVKLVSEKVGISEKQAKTAVEVVIGFLKDKLPSQAAGMLDKALSDEGGVDLGGAADMLGGLLKKK